MLRSVIIGSGSYIPERVITNDFFLDKVFYNEKGEIIDKPIEETIRTFEKITEIKERRYAHSNMVTSDMAAIAGERAIIDAGIDKEDLDYIIVAHNFGDIAEAKRQIKIMPSVSAQTKNKLNIKNRKCKPYDMIFGCPGWVESLILADQLIKAGQGKKFLIIGADTLSRSVDPYDRNSMIFADGSGAVVLEAIETDKRVGILSHCTVCDNQEELTYLTTGPSLNEDFKDSDINISMRGRKIYEYALKNVPIVMKEALDQTGIDVKEVKKLFIHQANAKMDYAMIDRFFKLYGFNHEDVPEGFAPMTVQFYGNTSVASIPTIYDMLMKGKFKDTGLSSGEIAMFSSVGSGMTINAIVYKMP